MLLIIQNLPYSVTYKDIKSLIYSKCGIDEIIVDNLVPHENNTKKVTIGLSGEEDAAVVMKKIDGTYLKGNQLRVVQKSKIPKMSSNSNQSQPQPGLSNSMQPFTHNSNGSKDMGFRPPLHGMQQQNIPPMIPPAMNVGTPNPMFYPNQSAFYMMNQSTYSISPNTPSVGYPTLPLGQNVNQGYPQTQSSWYNNNWNQQTTNQSVESSNVPPKADQADRWDKGDSRWNSNPKWEKRNSDWHNSESQWDNSSSQYNDDKSTSGNNNSRWNEVSERGNRSESRWNSSGGSNRDSHNDPSANTSRESVWRSSRDSKRDNTYRSNQTAGFSRDRGSPDRKYKRNDSPQPSGHIYGDHVRQSGSRSNKRQRDNEPQQNRFKSPPRKRGGDGSANDRNRFQPPPQNRNPNAKSAYIPDLDDEAVNEYYNKKNNRPLQIGRMWRGQFIATRAKNITEDPRFQYEISRPTKLFTTLKAIIKQRVNSLIQDDYSMNMFQIEKKYNKFHGFRGDWEALRDSLQKLGGKLLSKVDAGTENTPCGTIKKKKNKKVADSKQQGGPKSGRQPQASTSSVAMNNPVGTPLAMMPRRIPQYPQGDKQLFKKTKKTLKEAVSGDLSAPIFDRLKPAVRAAIDKEVDLLCTTAIDEVCNNNRCPDPNNVKFCNSLKREIPDEMKRALKVIVARRTIPILPLMVRIFASPPIKRLPLEDFLKKYKVGSLKKSKQKHPFYIAECKSVEDHDHLCLMPPVAVGNSMVTFKPLHLVDQKRKEKVNRSQENYEFDENVIQTDAEPIDIKTDDNNQTYNTEAEISTENASIEGTANIEKDLNQEMKDVYDEVNASDPNKIEETQNNEIDKYVDEKGQTNEEAFQVFNSIQTTDAEDFTSDIDIGNKTKNDTINESQQDSDENMEAIQEEHNIDTLDVNDEDLEDW